MNKIACFMYSIIPIYYNYIYIYFLIRSLYLETQKSLLQISQGDGFIGFLNFLIALFFILALSINDFLSILGKIKGKMTIYESCKAYDIYLFLTSLLEYNCFTILCQFLLYKKVNQLYVYTYPHIPSLLRLPPTLPIPPLQVVIKH